MLHREKSYKSMKNDKFGFEEKGRGEMEGMPFLSFSRGFLLEGGR